MLLRTTGSGKSSLKPNVPHGTERRKSVSKKRHMQENELQMAYFHLVDVEFRDSS